jgi:hypothetical protein
MNVRGALVVSFAFFTACSSADFAVAPSGGEDTGVDDTGSSTDSATTEDTAVEDTGSASDGAVEAAPCAPLDAASTTIYVDQRTTRTSVGSADCPARTIKEAIAIVGTLPSGKHVIKVAGGTAGSPIVYDESGALVLKAGTSLEGDGPGRVTITGGGTCSGTGCIFGMEGNSSIQGVTIDAKGPKIPVVMGPAGFTNCVLSHSVITGVKGSMSPLPAVFIAGNGTVDLGPELVVNKNESLGVYADSIFSIHVIAGGTGNRFNDNQVGFAMKTGFLNFDGGEVAKNSALGMAVSSTNGTVNITGLDAHDNALHGLVIDKGASLKMRNSSLNKNGGYGLVFAFTTGVSANDLDLGKSGDNGNNLLGAGSGSNKFGGVCLPVGRSLKGSAQGDRWSRCDPTQFPFTVSTGSDVSCDSPPPSYADVWYVSGGATMTPPLDTSGCTVGG